MKNILAIIYITAIISFCFGVYISRIETGNLISLRNYIDEFYAFAKGHDEEKTSFFQKVKSEATNKTRVDISANSKFLKVKLDENSKTVFRLNADKAIHSYGFLKDEHAFVSYVPLNSKSGILVVIGSDHKAFGRKIVKNIDFQVDLEAGEILLLSNNALRSYGLCSETPKWLATGLFHHYFTANSKFIGVLGTKLDQIVVERELALDDRRVYSDANHNVSIFFRKTGRLAASFDFEDIASANIEKFDPLVIEKTRINKKEVISNVFVNTKDYWHPNSVSMFPTFLNSERFDEKDALISAKGYNLVFVVDTETLEIKWYSQGMLQGQHDANWHNASSFTVFNNRSDRNPKGKFSQLKLYDFDTNEWSTLFDGMEGEAVTSHSGGHDIFNDFASMTLTKQGRHLVVDTINDKIINQFFLTNKNNIANVQEGKLINSSIIDKVKNCRNWVEIEPEQR